MIIIFFTDRQLTCRLFCHGHHHHIIIVFTTITTITPVTECICTFDCVCVVLCMLLCRCSFVCGRHSIFYVCVTCCYLDVTKRRDETARDKARGNNNGPSYVPSKRKEEIKSGTSVCGRFVVPYVQPAASIERLQSSSSSSSSSSRVLRAPTPNLRVRQTITFYVHIINDYAPFVLLPTAYLRPKYIITKDGDKMSNYSQSRIRLDCSGSAQKQGVTMYRVATVSKGLNYRIQVYSYTVTNFGS